MRIITKTFGIYLQKFCYEIVFDHRSFVKIGKQRSIFRKW